ncbi:hypothetical protein [Geodermatophilus sp. DSM 44513]|nr:hypothetical protein [Geodermatophilus sp. DSM 44513]WNV76017.1 hypothetical protein RTG05_01780 [Geodermatophilus sp. DSM 44513]
MVGGLVLWLVVAFGLAVLLGRGVHLADARAGHVLPAERTPDLAAARR